MITGGCLCGEIRYEVDGPAIGGGFCYCRDCQKVSGGMPAAVAVFLRSGYLVTAGAPASHLGRAESGADVTRTFCTKCGTHISASNLKHPEMLAIKVGTIDQPFRFAPSANLWTRSALSWHPVDSSMPSFPMQPAS